MTMGMFFWVKKVVPALIVAADGSGDFATIQAAIDALPATGGEVFVKAGTYTITAAIDINKSNVSIVGTGLPTIIQTSGDIPAFSSDSKTRLVISDLYILGSAGANPNNRAFKFTTITYSKIMNCRIENMRSQGFHWSTTCSNNIISNNIVTGSVFDGIYIRSGTNNQVYGNTCSSNEYNGIRCDFGTAIITGNFCSDNGTSGILLSQDDSVNNIVISNVCNSNGEYGIRIAADVINTVVSGNTCKLNTLGQVSDVGEGTQIGHNITS